MRTSKGVERPGDLSHPDARTRERGIEQLPHHPVSARVVVRLLKDPDGLVRNAALEWLHGGAHRNCLRAVLPSLRDRFNVARVSALECVACWGTAYHHKFVRPLQADSSPLVRAYAAWAIGELGGDSLASVLKGRLARERHQLAQAGLHEVLFRISGNNRHLRALTRYLSSADPRATPSV